MGCRCSPRFAEANSVDDESRAIERVGISRNGGKKVRARYIGGWWRGEERKEGGSSLESSLGLVGGESRALKEEGGILI